MQNDWEETHVYANTHTHCDDLSWRIVTHTWHWYNQWIRRFCYILYSIEFKSLSIESKSSEFKLIHYSITDMNLKSDWNWFAMKWHKWKPNQNREIEHWNRSRDKEYAFGIELILTSPIWLCNTGNRRKKRYVPNPRILFLFIVFVCFHVLFFFGRVIVYQSVLLQFQFFFKTCHV